MTCKQARELDMVDFLSQLGMQPVKPKGNNLWYYSPFRPEGKPSFKINRRLNRWYDFGEGTGGNLIDLAVRLKNCSVREFLQMLQDGTFTIQLHSTIGLSENTNTISFLSQTELTSPALLGYLASRKLPQELAARYCSEVHYQIDGHNYYAVGFANRSGGYELRSEYFKGSISPKDFTLLQSGNENLSVFEGFMDFLSYLVLYPNAGPTDFLVLNSLSFFDRALDVMLTYPQIDLYLDNDHSGDKATAKAKSIHDRFIDRRDMYYRSEDLNASLNEKYFR